MANRGNSRYEPDCRHLGENKPLQEIDTGDNWFLNESIMATNEPMLVVLGYISLQGTLSDGAKRRCAAAVDVLRSRTFSWIVTTGAFGKFNDSNRPHFALMAEHMQALIVSQGLVCNAGWKGTPTSFTLDDLFAVRRFALKEGIERIVIVTSQFHLERVTLAAKLVFRDRNVEFIAAKNPTDIDLIREQKIERIKSEALRRTWVDVPLFASECKFPTAIYANAWEQYKHSDTVSLSLIAGMFAMLFYPLVKGPDPNGFNPVALHLGASFLGSVLFIAYRRFAHFASEARNVMTKVEMGSGVPGYSFNHSLHHSESRWTPRFTSTRTLMFICLILGIGGNLFACFPSSIVRGATKPQVSTHAVATPRVAP